jgi:glycosyltransferase involved in cell wall biosynthesis
LGSTVYIYPAFNPRYYSTYIEGLRRVLGRSNLRYTAEGFPGFGSGCLALRIVNSSETRVYLHSDDMPELDLEGLRWSDVFGKVNLDPDLVPGEYRRKVFPLGPMFPVRVWDKYAAETRGLINYFLSQGRSDPFRKHIANYRGQYRTRFPDSDYHRSNSDPNYLFFNAAVWERETIANEVRARFVEAALRVEDLLFEGGLTPRKTFKSDRAYDGSEYARYLTQRYPPRENLEKTKRSVVAFNNPAYRDCHSWRLAESMALGKAIITTPIVRALPLPLDHGTHVHYVDGSVESMEAAIRRIRGDDIYRMKLESNARTYYETYLSPESVMRRVLDRAGVSLS